MRKLSSLFFSLLLVASFIPTTAFAEVSEQLQSAETISVSQAQDDVTDSGMWGTCRWELTARHLRREGKRTFQLQKHVQ